MASAGCSLSDRRGGFRGEPSLSHRDGGVKGTGCGNQEGQAHLLTLRERHAQGRLVGERRPGRVPRRRRQCEGACPERIRIENPPVRPLPHGHPVPPTPVVARDLEILEPGDAVAEEEGEGIPPEDEIAVRRDRLLLPIEAKGAYPPPP